MEESVEALPPLELKIRLSEDWLEGKINAYLPFSTVQNNTKIEILRPAKISFVEGLFRLELMANLEYSVKILGKVIAKVRMELEFAQLADIALLQVKLRKLEWMEDPKFKTTLGFGFNVKRIANSQLEKVKAEIAPTLEAKIPQAFENFTNTNAIYKPYLTQEIEDIGLNLKTNVKALFYQINPSVRWIELQVFPEIVLNVADRENSFLSSPGPFRPGVGGGEVDFNLDLTPEFINKHISDQVVGKAIKAGTRSITIEKINLSIGTAGIMVDLHFENNEPPKMKGILIPQLDVRTQILSFRIQQLALKDSSWFWKGLLSILKSSIESRIEKSLRINIKDIATKQFLSRQANIDSALKKQDLILKSYRPMIVFTELETSSENVIVMGKVGGFFEIWSQQELKNEGVIA